MNTLLNPLLVLTVVSIVIPLDAVNAQTYESRLKSYGLALPKENVMVRANIDSHVKSVLVKEGQFVKKGEVLVQLNCDSALAKQEIARLAADELGAKMNADAELKYARVNYEKVAALHERKAVNEKELNEALLRWERAKAQVKIAVETHAANQARLTLATAELDDHFLRAPFDGQVVELKVSPGSAIQSDMDIAQLVSSNELRVDLYLGMNEYNKMKAGDTCKLVVVEPFKGKQIDSTVVFQSPIIEATTGTRRVTLSIDNRHLQLPAGFTVSISE